MSLIRIWWFQYGYGSEGNAALGIPPGASLQYEVELQNFEKAKESWEMDQEEKVVQAKACKERGTAFLKQEKYQLAVKQYKKIIDLLEYDSGKLLHRVRQYHGFLSVLIFITADGMLSLNVLNSVWISELC